MNSTMFTLNYNDLIKGVATAVATAVIVALAGVMQTPGFNLFVADWGMIISAMFNVAVVSFMGYIGKNFLSDADGAVLGKYGGK